MNFKKLVVRTLPVLTLMFLAAGCSDSNLTESEYLQSASQYIEDEQFSDAIIQLKSTLQQYPDSDQASVLLGRLYLKFDDGIGAEKEFLKALKTKPAAPITPDLAKALLLQSRFEDVIGLISTDNLSTTQRHNLAASKAVAKINLGQLAQAEKDINDILTASPDFIPALEAEALLLITGGNTEEAKLTLGKLLKIDNTHAPAWELLGGLEHSLRNYADAEKAYSRAIEFKTNPLNILSNRALTYIELDNLESAEGDLNQIATIIKDYPPSHYAKGLIYLKREEYKQAQVEFEQLLNKVGDYAPALYFSGVAQQKIGQDNAATLNLEKYIAQVPNYPPALKLLADIQFKQKNYQEANNLLKASLKQEPEDPIALGMLAETLAAQQKYQEAISHLRKITVIQPDYFPARIGIAQNLIRLQEKDRAITELDKAIEIAPASPLAYMLLTSVFLDSGNLQAALDTAHELISHSEGSNDGFNLLASIYLQAGNDQKAQEIFNKVLKRKPFDKSANNGMAAIAIKTEDYKKALGFYKEILKKSPNDETVLLNLAEVYLKQDEKAQAIEVLEQLVEDSPQALKPRIKLGLLYADTEDVAKTPLLLKGFQEKYPDNIPLLVLLADSAIKMEQFSEAVNLLQAHTQIEPQNANIHYSLATTYQKQGNNAAYLEELKKTLELNPDHLAARVEFTNYLVVLNRLDEAEENLNLLKEKFDRSAEALLIEGKIAEQKKDYLAATAAYKPIYENTPSNLNLVRYTNALWLSGAQQKSVELLEKWLNDTPDDIAVLLQLSNRYLALEMYSKAESGYKALLEREPKTTLALNNLAWLLRSKETDNALTLAEEALKNSPDSPAVMDTLSEILLIKGRKKDLRRAQRLMEEALTKSPKNPGYLLRSAKIDLSMGENPHAKNKLETIKDLVGDFPEKQEALELLER